MSTVDIKAVGKHDLAIEWVGSVTNDMVADSVIALVLGVDGSPASVKSPFSRLRLPSTTNPSAQKPRADTLTPTPILTPNLLPLPTPLTLPTKKTSSLSLPASTDSSPSSIPTLVKSSSSVQKKRRFSPLIPPCPRSSNGS